MTDDKPTIIECPSPGIYHDVPFDEYLAWPAVNQSSLKPALESAAHYRHAQDNPPDGNKDCFRFGRLCHRGKLEPLEALGRYVVMPDFTIGLTNDNGEAYKNPKATKAYKEKVAEFERVNSDKEVVTQDWYDQLNGIVSAINNHERANAWLNSKSPAEVSMVWDDPLTGLRCKGRVDKLIEAERLIVDLKTTGRSVCEFARDILTFHYDLQAAFYIDGITLLTGQYGYGFGLIAAEKSAPHGVRAAELHQDDIEAGRAKYRKALRLIADCREQNAWPGPIDPPAWSVPTWSQAQLSLTTGGQPITL